MAVFLSSDTEFINQSIVSSGSISSNFAKKAKDVQILNMSRFTLFGDQSFRGSIC